MSIGPIVFKELVKNGYSLRYGTRVWDVAKRDLLYMTPDLANSFLSLRSHDRYKANLINKEVQLLEKNIGKVCDIIGEDAFNLIDVGCGDGLKAKKFIELLQGKAKVRFCPVSPSQQLVDLTLKNVQDAGFDNVVSCDGYVKNFVDLDEVIGKARGSEFQRSVILLLGSLLASFDVNYYLRRASEAMFPGDVLLIGNGIRAGERFTNLETYRAPIF